MMRPHCAANTSWFHQLFGHHWNPAPAVHQHLLKRIYYHYIIKLLLEYFWKNNHQNCAKNDNRYATIRIKFTCPPFSWPPESVPSWCTPVHLPRNILLQMDRVQARPRTVLLHGHNLQTQNTRFLSFKEISNHINEMKWNEMKCFELRQAEGSKPNCSKLKIWHTDCFFPIGLKKLKSFFFWFLENLCLPVKVCWRSHGISCHFKSARK